MNEFKIGDEIVKYKSGLTEAEYITVIEYTIDAYKYGIGEQVDELEIVPYNPIKAQQAFFRALFSICIEDYNSDKFSEYFEAGLTEVLTLGVANASMAWDTIQEIISNSMSMSVTINKFLSGVLNILDEKLPDGVDMGKVLKKFPKDLSKALAEYTSVMQPSKAEFDKKVEDGEYKHLEKEK